MSLRILVAVAMAVGLAGAARAAEDEAATVKEAFVRFMQARMDLDPVAARAASSGDEMAYRVQDAEIAVSKARRRLVDAVEKQFPPAQPTSRPATQQAAVFWKSMLDGATVEVKGETAQLRSPTGAVYGFKKIEGTWKVDLNNFGPGFSNEVRLRKAQVGEKEMTAMTEEVLAGKFKTREEFEKAIAAREMRARQMLDQEAASRPTTQP